MVKDTLIKLTDKGVCKSFPYHCITGKTKRFKYCRIPTGILPATVCLLETARILQHSIRKSDIPCRFGGDEFAIIFPQLNTETARTASEKLRNIIAEHTFNYDSRYLKLTLSIGLASLNSRTKSAMQLIEEAVTALYQAKEGGRNRTAVFTP